MNIAFCSSEVYPFAKTGGLADVCGALPFALAKLGCKVKVFMPWYKGIEPQQWTADHGVTMVEGVEIVFVRHNYFFWRDALYGTPYGDYEDNLERFCFFSQKIFELLKTMQFKPQMLHCNDWQTALVNVYLRSRYAQDDFFRTTRSVLTIHNIAYQGVFAKEKFALVGLPDEYFTMQRLEFYDKVNLLKGGIVFADMINTVSPNYAQQIQMPEYGWGLDGVLRQRRARLRGICNAVDYRVWDPQRDKNIYSQYSFKNIENKYKNKQALQKKLGIPEDRNKLLLGMVSRLTEQKGIDILVTALPAILAHCQVVILGIGDERYHMALKSLEKRFKQALSVHLTFDEAFAHRIYAGSDCLLMPSQFEPCGISQMISYKYATVPIVHATGGLVDTVVDYSRGGGGFVFDRYLSAALIYAVERARWMFGRHAVWRDLLRKIISYDFSWHATAGHYKAMYEEIGK